MGDVRGRRRRESMLAGERVAWMAPCPPRDLAAVARNAVAARRLFRDHDVHLVVSTGAALALAVLPQARLRGIETVYIESATRRDRPSLSGRAMAAMPGITTFSQSSDLARGGWQYLASPWDLYDVTPTAPRPIRSMVVSLGTQEDYGFRRLLERLVPMVPARAPTCCGRPVAPTPPASGSTAASGCRRRRCAPRSATPTSWSPTPAPASR